MKLIFAGTPDFAASHLSALIEAGHEVVAVYTQPDRPANRGKKLTPSAVKSLALNHQIPVEQPQNFKSDSTLAALRAYEADVMVVVAYGLLLPKSVLETPKAGCINVHGSLLPKWRGAAPIQRSIWAGDKESGVSIMQMDEGLDTGDILLMERITLSREETSASLYEKLASLGPKALLRALEKFSQLERVKQDDSQASYANKLSKTEAKLDWQQSATQLERNVRAFNPWPVAWFSLSDKNIKVWAASVLENHEYKLKERRPGEVLAFTKLGLDVACKDSVLRITNIQMPGKKALDIELIVNGNPKLFAPGQHLDD
uniref:methionyl-tRNA formyltransferase n=1 Tax=Ningiella ruwaisensis TaxID=2364274 RepID=UPI0010A0AB9A|nr:methionyl-tRNA formyltransferase [Ningiella ruwaisensis]